MFGIETQDLIIYAFLVLALPAGLIGFLLAGSKHRGAFGWLFVCLFFPPAIIALLFLNRIEDLEDEVRRLKKEADARESQD